MSKVNFFFEKRKFFGNCGRKDLNNTYYLYKGYYQDASDGSGNKKQHYPLSLRFGRGEIAIYYTDIEDKRVRKVYSLQTVDGNLNQRHLAEKIENYALMPLWPANTRPPKKELRVNVELLNIGYFPCYFGFCLEDSKFKKNGSLDNDEKKEERLPEIRDKALKFTYALTKDRDTESQSFQKKIWKIIPTKQNDKVKKTEKKYSDTWRIENDENNKLLIKCDNINFFKILLDFLFELEKASTFEFEDKFFFQIKQCLSNNYVICALTNKCQYLFELDRTGKDDSVSKEGILKKHFLEAERSWLNVCRLPEYRRAFTSTKSMFQSRANEVKTVFFDSRIGKENEYRRKFLNNMEGRLLRNEVCTFFMRDYNIWAAFRCLMGKFEIACLFISLFLIPFLDLFLPPQWTGLSTYFLPMCILFLLFLKYKSIKVNLFRLFLPRMTLGIMFGWAIFWSNQDLWKKAIGSSFNVALLLTIGVLVLLFLYVYTDISNHTYQNSGRNPRRENLIKAGNLLAMAGVLSLVMGHYVIQFFAVPLLENSGSLNHPVFYEKNLVPSKYPDLECFFHPESCDQYPLVSGENMMTQEKHDIFLYPSIKDICTKDSDERVLQGTFIYNGSSAPQKKLQKKPILRENIKYFLKIKDLKVENFHIRKIILPSRLEILSPLVSWLHIDRIVYIFSVLFSQTIISIFMGVVLQMIWEDRPITEPL